MPQSNRLFTNLPRAKTFNIMKIEIKQTLNKDIERVLTTAYKSSEKVPKEYHSEDVAINFVGFVKPRIHFIIPADESVKVGTPIIITRDGEKVCKQLKVARIQDFTLRRQADGMAVNHIFDAPNGEMIGYFRTYAGLVTFCTPIIARIAEHEGHKDVRNMVSGMEDGDYKLLFVKVSPTERDLVNYVFPGEE